MAGNGSVENDVQIDEGLYSRQLCVVLLCSFCENYVNFLIIFAPFFDGNLLVHVHCCTFMFYGNLYFKLFETSLVLSKLV